VPTFRELQEKLHSIQQRRVVLNHIVEYLDNTFGGAEPDKFLLTDKKERIGPEAFEAVVEGIILEGARALEAEEHEILNLSISPPPPPQEEQQSFHTAPVVNFPQEPPRQAVFLAGEPQQFQPPPPPTIPMIEPRAPDSQAQARKKRAT
jgi:hypothetical protein